MCSSTNLRCRRVAGLLCGLALASALGWVPARIARAQSFEPRGDGAMSIQYQPAPQPAPQKRTRFKQRAAEKPTYRRPWAEDTRRGRWKGIGLGIGGLATAFVSHELGHVLMNLAYGNVPTVEGLRYGGVIPFFRISPNVSCNEVGCFDSNGDPFKGGRTGGRP